ncbi:NH(3)-dependent NAD(+) synthetase [compost metagenome]
MLDTNVGQPDETELGITYDQLDDYLEGKDVEDEIAEKIEKRYILTEHKRQLPATPHDIKIK